MIKTFGRELQHFAYSIDSVEDSDLSAIENKITSYLLDFLKIKRAEFFLEGPVEGEPGVIPQWNEADKHGGVKIGGVDKPNGHCGYCFNKNVSLWITAKDEETLDESNAFIDHWSGVDDLPMYEKTNYTGYKTAIIIPIKRSSYVFALLYLGSKEYLVPNEQAKNELLSIANGYGIMFRMAAANKHRISNTTNARKNMLGQFVGKVDFILNKPTIFFAYSGSADSSVIGTIISVLGEYEADFKLIRWDNSNHSGAINMLLIKSIAEAKCGICFFSEPIEEPAEDALLYSDNPNVLIEAGMLHALCNDPTAEPVNWIPIREDKEVSGPIPFDFSSDSFIHIKRDPVFNEHALKSDLVKRIDEIKKRVLCC